MKNRADTIEAIAAILRTSCCADGCLRDEVLTSIAGDIADTLQDLEAGSSVEDAVLANWEMDDVERREVFGT